MHPIRDMLQPHGLFGVNSAQYVVSTGGLREAELDIGELSLSLVLSLHLLQDTQSNPSTSFFFSVGA